MRIKKDRAYLLKEIYYKTDQLVQAYLIFCMGLSFFLASIYGYWHMTILMNSFFWFVYALFSYGFYSRNPRRVVMVILVKLYPILFIVQTGGQPLMHAFFVVAGVILVAYHNFNFVALAVGTKLVYYVIMFSLFFAGFDISKFFWSTPAYFSEMFFPIMMVLGVGGASQLLLVYYQKGQFIKYVALHESLYEYEKREELHKDFAMQIANNQLDQELKVDANDPMGLILCQMQAKLQENAKKNQERNWTAEGLARFSDMLRKYMQSPELLYDKIAEELANYLKVNQVALFLVKKIPTQQQLELVSAYAFERKRIHRKTLQMGEGLVGQACLEKQTIYLTDVPQHYIRITSGLGQALPRNIVIVPFLMNNEVFAVLEVASFQVLEKYQVDFLEKLGESIANTISVSEANHLTRQLLREAQTNQEALKAQEEELRQNLEELQSTQESMSRKQRELEKLNEKLEAGEQVLKRTFEKFERKEQKNIAEKRELANKISHLEQEIQVLKVEIKAKDQKIKELLQKQS